MRSWLLENFPAQFRYLPSRLRLTIVHRHLGPRSPWSLKRRLESVDTLLSREIVGAKTVDGRVELSLNDGAGALLPEYVRTTGVDAVSIDWTTEPSFIRESVQNHVAVQGNLDPLVLIAGGTALDRAIDDVLANFAGGRLIFNLGHGIQPETPIAHVEQMVKRVRACRA